MASGHSELLLPPKISTNGDGALFGCELCCHTETNPYGFCLANCFNVCPQVCKILVSVFDDPLFPPSSPPPPPPPYSRPILANRDAVFPRSVLKFGLIFLSALITCVFLLGIIWQVWKFYKSRQNDTFDSSRRRDSSPILFHTQESFRDENQGPDIDHPIWYINTVGLQQSIIDSIVVCKYKKDEGLIEGTDCSICLSEFEEDESLRLLPKCSHAFHIPCIDTWLRSHKNCPLCRAPIVSDNFAVQAQSSMEPVNSNDLDSREEAEEDNIVNNASALESEEVGGGETSGLRVGNGVGEENSPVEAKRLNYPSRVRSDLVENRQASTEGELQPVRRSVSMDSVSAMRIYSAVANVVPVPVPDNQIKKSKSKISSSKRRSGSFSVMKLMSGSSTGPILMKRSFSSSGKAASSSSTRGNRSLDSILPL